MCIRDSDVGGDGQPLHQRRLIEIGDEIECMGVEVVAQQDRGGVAEAHMGGLAAAAGVAVVDQIVVDQGRGVDHLQRRTQPMVGVPGRAKGLGDQHHQSGTQHLAMRCV